MSGEVLPLCWDIVSEILQLQPSGLVIRVCKNLTRFANIKIQDFKF